MESFITLNIENLTSTVLYENSTMAFADVLTTTVGPQVMQISFNNQTVADKVLLDTLHLIDSHWYQFPPIDLMWHKILGFVMIVLGIMEWTGNGIVTYVFLVTFFLRTI